MNPDLNKQNAPAPTDGQPFWLKQGARLLGTASALIALCLGAWVCVTVTAACLLAGIIQMLSAVVVALVEAPCFCVFLDFAQGPSAYFEQKPYWYRSLLYIIMSILPLAMCFELSTLFGAGLIFVTGIVYGVMTLGKKAPADEMKMRARSTSTLLPNEVGDTQPGSV